MPGVRGMDAMDTPERGGGGGPDQVAAQQRGEPIGCDWGGINRARCRVGCNLPPPTPRGFARTSIRLAGRPNPCEQLARRFVAGVLGHQLAAEGLGKQGWGEAIDDLSGGGEAGFELVG